MKKVFNLPLNLLTDKYLIGTLGKPHSLKGFQYIKIDSFFKNLNLKDIELYIQDEIYKVEEFKRHLKDRNLIKFQNVHSINEVETLRNNKVFITKNYSNVLLNIDNLPWPGFFLNTVINKSGHKLISYKIYNNFLFCKVENVNDYEIPYNNSFFNYEDNILTLKNSDLTVNPFK